MKICYFSFDVANKVRDERLLLYNSKIQTWACFQFHLKKVCHKNSKVSVQKHIHKPQQLFKSNLICTLTMRQIYNLLFEKLFLVIFTRRIRMSDEFRLMNSLDNLIRVRIYYWKHVLVDGTSLTMTSEGGGGR